MKEYINVKISESFMENDCVSIPDEMKIFLIHAYQFYILILFHFYSSFHRMHTGSQTRATSNGPIRVHPQIIAQKNYFNGILFLTA